MHGCVRMRRPGRPIGGYCILGELFQKIFIFIVHSNYAASSNRASVFPVPRIYRQYQLYSSYTNRVTNQIFDDVTSMDIGNLKKYFANSLSSLPKIKHRRPVLKFWKRIHNTWKIQVIYDTKKEQSKRKTRRCCVYNPPGNVAKATVRILEPRISWTFPAHRFNPLLSLLAVNTGNIRGSRPTGSF